MHKKLVCVSVPLGTSLSHAKSVVDFKFFNLLGITAKGPYKLAVWRIWGPGAICSPSNSAKSEKKCQTAAIAPFVGGGVSQLGWCV